MKNRNIIGKEISTKAFTWCPKSHTFVTEVSDFNDGSNVPAPFNRLYSDACDVGFVLVSHVTGDKVPFFLAETKKDDEGDAEAWMFESVGEKVAARVVIIND